jgi:hypothetical protein
VRTAAARGPQFDKLCDISDIAWRRGGALWTFEQKRATPGQSRPSRRTTGIAALIPELTAMHEA